MKSLPYIIILLLLSLIGNYLQYRSAREGEAIRYSENKAYQDFVKSKNDRITAAEAYISLERRERRKSDSLYRSEQGARKSDLNALKRRERSLRPDTVLRTLIDTVYQTYDETLIACEERIKTDSVSFTKEIDSLSSIGSIQLAKFEKADAERTIFQDKFEKERRKRVSFGPYVGYGVSKEGLSPGIGVSVQYSIFKF